MLVAYGDESGTHDRMGKECKVAVAGGYVASVETWDSFNDQWGKVLDKYDAKSFHFSEWAFASAVARGKKRPSSSFDKNPYCGWSLDKKLDPFALELAQIARTVRQGIFAGYVNTAAFQAAKSDATSGILIGHDPFEWCLIHCFESFWTAVRSCWPGHSDSISLKWDTSPTEWRKSVQDIYEQFRKKDTRLCQMKFVDKDARPHFPLQAADMFVGRIRQLSERAIAREYPAMSMIDTALFGISGRELLQLQKGNMNPMQFFR